MSITRWDPWSEMMSLREAMDELLRESFVRPRALLGQTGMGMAVDVWETDDEFVVKATMPGVRPDDIDIQIKGDTLQIEGEVKEEYEESERAQEGKRPTWLVRERRFGRFQRTITLPTAVQADKAEANYEHGILTIHLPKAEESKARSIPIRAGGQHQIEAKSRTRS